VLQGQAVLAVPHEEQASLVEKKPPSFRRQYQLSLGEQVQAMVDPTEFAFRIRQAKEDPAPKLGGRWSGLSLSIVELSQGGMEQPGSHCRMHVAKGRGACRAQCLGALEA
jgi:hypothetical protein